MSSPVWIEERELRAIQAELLARYGGTPGVRDEALLKATLESPRALFAAHPEVDIYDLTVEYLYALTLNRPFHSANQRTALVVSVLFIELNGYQFGAREADAAVAVQEVAAQRLRGVPLYLFLELHMRERPGGGGGYKPSVRVDPDQSDSAPAADSRITTL